MNIAIIVYSHFGHTLSVAAKLQEALSAAGHTVNLERVEAAGPVRPTAIDVPLKTRPEIAGYDALVFGAPVWGGTLASPMASYLEQVPSLRGKKVACLVTHLFPPGWGGDRTIGQMKEICESKGATVCGSGSVGWPRLGRRRKIAGIVEDLAACFGS
jgi:NAD(P)H dehydrogenase (quinone)